MILNTHSISYCHLLKCPTVKWFCSLHIHISFHLAKLLVMDVILYHNVFPRRIVIFAVFNQSLPSINQSNQIYIAPYVNTNCH